MNDALTVILRGHAFVPLYVNPRNMNPRRWGSLAGLIQWARANEATLAETTPLLPEAWQGGKVPHFAHEPAMPRQPYGYMHWVGDRGLVLSCVIRGIKQQTVHLDLAGQVGVPESGARSVRSQSLPRKRVFTART